MRGAAEYRGVEQLEARRAHNPEVVGSSPTSATTKTDTKRCLFFIIYLDSNLHRGPRKGESLFGERRNSGISDKSLLPYA